MQIKPESKIFATLDRASGYYQVVLAVAHRDITTFITPFGRFWFERLPMGLSPSGDYFNIATVNLIASLEAVNKSIDDMLVEGSSKTELANKLIWIFQACKDNGVTLNPQKFKVGTQVGFGGFVVKHDPKFSSSPRMVPRVFQKIQKLYFDLGKGSNGCHYI